MFPRMVQTCPPPRVSRWATVSARPATGPGGRSGDADLDLQQTLVDHPAPVVVPGEHQELEALSDGQDQRVPERQGGGVVPVSPRRPAQTSPGARRRGPGRRPSGAQSALDAPPTRPWARPSGSAWPLQSRLTPAATSRLSPTCSLPSGSADARALPGQLGRGHRDPAGAGVEADPDRPPTGRPSGYIGHETYGFQPVDGWPFLAVAGMWLLGLPRSRSAGGACSNQRVVTTSVVHGLINLAILIVSGSRPTPPSSARR